MSTNIYSLGKTELPDRKYRAIWCGYVVTVKVFDHFYIDESGRRVNVYKMLDFSCPIGIRAMIDVSACWVKDGELMVDLS